MTGLSVEIKPLRGSSRRVEREMRRMARKINNRRLVNRQVSTWLSRWVKDNFRTAGSNVGGWEPFKYGGRVMRGGFIDASAVLLVDTGKMRASFIPFSDGEQAGIGSALDRALYHDQGTATLPARRLLPEEGDRKVEDAILRIYDAHIRRATQ